MFWLILIGGGVGYVLWRVACDRRHEAWEEAQRQGYRDRIAANPSNAAAYETLGDSLHKAGRLQEARDCYLRACAILGNDTQTAKIDYKLKQLDEDIRDAAAGSRSFLRELRQPVREVVFCRMCGAPNPPQKRRCALCRARLPYKTFFEAIKDRELQRASIEGICMMAICLILMALLAGLPIEIRGLLFISTVLVVGWRLLYAIDGRRG